MPVSRDPGVNAGQALTAVDDDGAHIRINLQDSSDGAAKHRKRKVLFTKGAEEGAIQQLLLDVGVDVLLGKVGGGEVDGCMAWI